MEENKAIATNPFDEVVTQIVTEQKPVKIVEDHTDVGNAAMFVKMHSGHVIYVPEWEKRLTWNGTRLAHDEVLLYGRVHQVIEARFKEAEAALTMDLITRHGEPIACNDALKWAKKTSSKSRMASMLKLVKHDATIVRHNNLLDAEPFVLGCKNGLIDLRSGKFVEPDPSRLNTKCADVEYSPNADCPGWKSFISDVANKRDDLADYLQEIVGYSLCGSIDEQCIYICHGRGGNGKSVLLDVVLDIMGDCAARKVQTNIALVLSAFPLNGLFLSYAACLKPLKYTSSGVW